LVEAKEKFLEKKVVGFIEANKERVLELADTSIFLEVQTHLGEIDEKDPKFEFDAKSNKDLEEAFRVRVIYSALTGLGLLSIPTIKESDGRISAVLSGLIELKIGSESFQKRVAEIVEKCLGKKWENGQVVKSGDVPNVNSIKVYSDGFMWPGSFTTNNNDQSYRYFINDERKSIDGADGLGYWWPHPLGIVIKDQSGNMLLNGRDLIESPLGSSRGALGIESTPSGLMWVDVERNIHLNGKIVARKPVDEKQLNQFVGLSKRGVVEYRRMAGVGDEYAEAAGIYINGEQVYGDYDIDRAEAVVSRDFDFAVEKRYRGHGSSVSEIYLDGKYPIKTKTNYAVEKWWVHPRGIIIMHSNKEFRFYSFDAVKAEIQKDLEREKNFERVGEKVRMETAVEKVKKLAERKDQIRKDTLGMIGSLKPTAEEIDRIVDEVMGKQKDVRTKAEIERDNELIKRRWIRAGIMEEYADKPTPSDSEINRMVDARFSKRKNNIINKEDDEKE
ncbi:MAG: hypothetical protein HY226_02475, partial [Candidatus Vogelbacteria bacterium]|nr:hypothetical protein [Candidatus Vogelbacteria bacterium]